MSLNGLDEAAVAEAHQAALADAGGWYVQPDTNRSRRTALTRRITSRFLLKYANRDTVELLQKGTGGIQEVRGVVERYEEKSPLYGMVQYRRKKVILKYVPEGTSRLLQGSFTYTSQVTTHDTLRTMHG